MIRKLLLIAVALVWIEAPFSNLYSSEVAPEELSSLFDQASAAISQRDRFQWTSWASRLEQPFDVVDSSAKGGEVNRMSLGDWLSDADLRIELKEIEISQPSFSVWGDVAVVSAELSALGKAGERQSGEAAFSFVRSEERGWRVVQIGLSVRAGASGEEEANSPEEVARVLGQMRSDYMSRDASGFESRFVRADSPFYSVADVGAVAFGRSSGFSASDFVGEDVYFPGQLIFLLGSVDVSMVGGRMAYARADYGWVKEGRIMSRGSLVSTAFRDGEGKWKLAGVYMEPSATGNQFIRKPFGGKSLLKEDTLDYHVSRDWHTGDIYLTQFKTLPDYTIVRYTEEKGKWVPAPPPSFAKGFSCADPFFSPDGSFVIFSSHRSLKTGGESSQLTLWKAQRTPDGWGEPEPLGFQGLKTNLFHSSLDNAGNLYFLSFSNGKGQIYTAPYLDGEYGEPTPLPKAINNGSVGDPCISPDGSFLVYYVAIKTGRAARAELYIARRDENGVWREGKSLGAMVNARGWNFGPQISPDGAYLTYSSWDHLDWKSDSKMDHLHWVKLNSGLGQVYVDFESSIRAKDRAALHETALYPGIPLNISMCDGEKRGLSIGTGGSWFDRVTAIPHPYEIRIGEVDYLVSDQLALSVAPFGIIERGKRTGGGVDLFLFLKDKEGRWKISCTNNTYYGEGKECPREVADDERDFVELAFEELVDGLSSETPEDALRSFVSKQIPFAEADAMRTALNPKSGDSSISEYVDSLLASAGSVSHRIDLMDVKFVDGLMAYATGVLEIQENEESPQSKRMVATLLKNRRGKWKISCCYLRD